MTTPTRAPTDRPPDLAAVRERLAPVIARVGERVVDHERERSLPHAEVRALAAAGFGALRLPLDEGGAGLGLADFVALLLEVAAADSNQPQIWRNHIAFVEDRLQPQPAERNAAWRKRIAGGAVVGGAWSERANKTFADSVTVLAPGRDGWLLNGRKYYSTGSNFADWISVAARKEGQEAGVIAVVAADHPGVTVADDWGGFGQRTTGSGTSVFVDVPVGDEGLYAFTDRAPYQEALYQLVHVVTLAGIARAAHRDVIARLRARTRSYPHAMAPVPRDDGQLLAVVGRVGAQAAAAEAVTARAARVLEHAATAAITGAAPEAVTAAVDEGAVAVYEAQVAAAASSLEATTLIFDALGSSGVAADAALDRHWRNARVIASHNPLVYKERLLGAWYVNGDPPVAYGELTTAST